MNLIISGIVVFVLFIINNFIIGIMKSKFGENEWSDKANENSRNIFSSLFGLGLIALSYYWIEFLKWPLIVFFGLAFSYEFIVSFLISFVLGIFIKINKAENQKEAKYTLVSSFVASLCYGYIVYVIITNLFIV